MSFVPSRELDSLGPLKTEFELGVITIDFV